ncbi:MlaD family protein [Flavobacterium sp.]|jgi:phospholipid/cholesterol/gamma-HCH transport system substrate-binding protein|uniref:MlaD family protein n=1 Tax=Flavobacterium sp. TaxID=239 RepID=UPI002CFB891A|nr:MlaD family protein [Flavobacterium sp.]MCA0350134.1 MlaD family protein [Bacteroidota bacterium]HQA73738.1 MlaD family protein [Flavobacterium sp.]
MENTNYKQRLGLFVFIGLIFFVGIIFLIGRQQNLFSAKIKISTAFKNASGLKVGNAVRFSGIAIGTVDNIEIVNDSTVKVEMNIKNDTQKFIKTDSKASITSEGVIGDKILVISQGSSTSKSISDGQKIGSFEPIEFSDVLANVKVSAENAEVITHELATILTNINDGEGTLGKLMTDEDMAEDLDATMENLRKSSKGLNENMEAAKHNFLLRGYFKKKEREKRKAAEKAKKEAEKKQENQKK